MVDITIKPGGPNELVNSFHVHINEDDIKDKSITDKKIY